MQTPVKEEVLQKLEDKGHSLRTTDRGIGGAVMLSIDPATGLLQGAGGWCGVLKKN